MIGPAATEELGEFDLSPHEVENNMNAKLKNTMEDKFWGGSLRFSAKASCKNGIEQ